MKRSLQTIYNLTYQKSYPCIRGVCKYLSNIMQEKPSSDQGSVSQKSRKTLIPTIIGK